MPADRLIIRVERGDAIGDVAVFEFDHFVPGFDFRLIAMKAVKRV